LCFSKNATATDKPTTAAVFNVPHRDSLGKYLGSHVFQGRTFSSTFSNLLRKADNKLQNWKVGSVFKAGQIVLIQSNLESLSSHTIECFKLPKSASNTLDGINRDFFWKKSNIEKGLPMVSWDKVCCLKKKKKKKSGLNFKK